MTKLSLKKLKKYWKTKKRLLLIKLTESTKMSSLKLWTRFALNISVFFILTDLAQAKHTVLIPLSADKESDLVLGINDFNQLKILMLGLLVSALIGIIKIIWDFVKNKNLDINGRIKNIEQGQEDILKAIQRLDIHLAQVKDAQVDESEVRNLIRNEMEYMDNVQRRKGKL